VLSISMRFVMGLRTPVGQRQARAGHGAAAAMGR